MGWPVGWTIADSWRKDDHPTLPVGLDSARYRCCGNGVVSNVAEAIGRALLSVMEAELAA